MLLLLLLKLPMVLLDIMLALRGCDADRFVELFRVGLLSSEKPTKCSKNVQTSNDYIAGTGSF